MIRGQLTIDAAAAVIISAFTVMLLTNVAEQLGATGISSFNLFSKESLALKAFELATSPSVLGTTSMTLPGPVTPISVPRRVVDVGKLKSHGATDVDSPVTLPNLIQGHTVVFDLKMPNDDVSNVAVKRVYDVALYGTGNVSSAPTPAGIGDVNGSLAHVSVSGGSITVTYSPTTPPPGNNVVVVAVSGTALRELIKGLISEYYTVLKTSTTEGAFPYLASKYVSVSASGGTVVFASSTGWATSSPTDFVEKLIADGESIKTLYIIFIGGSGGNFTVTLSNPNTLTPDLDFALLQYPVKAVVGVK